MRLISCAKTYIPPEGPLPDKGIEFSITTYMREKTYRDRKSLTRPIVSLGQKTDAVEGGIILGSTPHKILLYTYLLYIVTDWPIV